MSFFPAASEDADSRLDSDSRLTARGSDKIYLSLLKERLCSKILGLWRGERLFTCPRRADIISLVRGFSFAADGKAAATK